MSYSNTVRIEPSMGVFPPTFMQNTSRIAVKIVNESDKIVRYEWRFTSSDYEEEQITKQIDPYDMESREGKDKMFLFNSKTFNFNTISSEIWPKRHQQILVSFTPNDSTEHLETAYLYIKETKERVPFILRGIGKPPVVELNAGAIYTGRISINETYEYQIMMKNTGKVDADFTIEGHGNIMTGFEFNPSSGHINQGSILPLNVKVRGSHVGQFNEMFVVALKGSPQTSPTFFVRGKVVGPKFQLSTKNVDFGTVSFGFLYTKTFDLINTSDLPAVFSLNINQDSSFDPREFSIIPNTGTIPKRSKIPIRLEFLPVGVHEYNLELLLNNLESEQTFSTPIYANCICPNIRIATPEIKLGNIDIDYRTDLSITLINDTEYPGKYEFMDSYDSSTLEAIFETEKRVGEIPAKSKHEVKFYIKPKMVGSIHLHRYIRILGSSCDPISFVVEATSMGPNLELSEKEINYGTIAVLQDQLHEFEIFNNSLIPAPYTVSVKNTNFFTIQPEAGEIEPKSSQTFKVIANINDTLNFSDELFFIFKNLSPVIIPITAKGKGTAIVSTIEMTKIDLGFSFIGMSTQKTFDMKNHGDRSFELVWETKRSKEDPDARIAIYPESKVIRPGEEVQYTISVTSKKVCDFNIKLVCTANIGKKRREIFQPMISGSFIQPALSIERKSIDFVYIHDTDAEEGISGKILTKDQIAPSSRLLKKITEQNSFIICGELPLKVIAKVDPPFAVYPTEFNAVPNERVYFDITFDTTQKKDFNTEFFKKELRLTFENNPQFFSIQLNGEMHFPNVSFDCDSNIDFGTQIVGTEGEKTFTIENTSCVEASYYWILQSETIPNVSQVFDIYPIKGVLSPGQQERVTLSFFAYESDIDDTFTGRAICHIIGGPEYPFSICGTTSPLNYKISPKVIDFGNRPYNNQISSAVVITNVSNVPLKFKVKIPKKMGLFSFSVDPECGEIEPDQQISLNIQLVPGSPIKFSEVFIIQIDKFEEVEIEMHVNCFLSQLVTDMPRCNDDPLLVSYASRPRRNKSKEIKFDQISAEHLSHIETQLMISRINMRMRSPRNISARRGAKAFENYALSKFVVDLGTIVLNNKCSKTFTIRSVTPYPISFDILADSLEGTGFSIDRTEFNDIPPNEDIPITFSFDIRDQTEIISGDLSFNLFVKFTDDNLYAINLKASIEMPTLKFSATSFDFIETIIGQMRVQTLQIVNDNDATVEFSISQAQASSVVRGRKKNPFRCSPSTAILEPNSYINVDIIFAPEIEKNFSMQFPVSIKYNTQNYYISVKGSGIQMKLIFDPPRIDFPTITPFSNPIEQEFKLKNPTSYPITVYSTQFDFQLFSEKLQSNLSSLNSTRLSQPITPTLKFRVCVIVNGSPKSGKTTVSNIIASYLKLPIIVLSDIFANKDSKEECLDALLNLVSSSYYDRGFVVDGLDAFPDPPEAEQFVNQVMKHKGIIDELEKNPFVPFKHNCSTGCEQALSLLLQSLDGHIVIGVDLYSNQQTLQEHEAKLNEEKKKFEEKSALDKIKEYFMMNEDTYSSLTYNEKKKVDKARKEFRKNTLNSILHSPKEIKPVVEPPQVKQTTPKKPGRGKVIRDLKLSVIQFTFGTIAEMIANSQSNFIVYDASHLNKPEDEEIITYNNSIYFNTEENIESIERKLKWFIPDYAVIKTRYLSGLIYPERTIIQSENEDGESHLEEMPQFFTIVSKGLSVEQQTTKTITKKPRSSRRAHRDESKTSLLSQEENIFENYDLTNYIKRIEIMPESSVTLKAKFSGRIEGVYSECFNFAICDSSNSNFSLPLFAQCKYPEIERDPLKIFSSVVPRLKMSTTNSFVSSLNEFHFGPILVQTGKIGGKNFKPAYTNIIKIHNPGPLPAIVTPSLKEGGGKTSPWFFDSKTFTIRPNETINYKFALHPLAADLMRNRLSFFIKDNPEIYSFDIVADACIPTIKPEDTNIDFDKMLTTQSRTINFELKNTGKVPAIFKLKGQQALGPSFSFSVEEGIIPARGSTTLEIKFSSEKPLIIKKQFQIDVYDNFKTRIFNSHHINVAAESFDSNCEMTFQKGANELNFGYVKVGVDKTVTCSLRNKGRYPISYAFEIIKKFPYIRINNMSGVINPGEKPKQVEITFIANKVMKFVNKKAVTMKVYDLTSNTLTNTISLPVSIETTTSVYEIDPPNALDFGACIFNVTNTKKLIIRNKGPFPFDFEIAKKVVEVKEPKKAVNQPKKHGRGLPLAKSKSNRNLNKKKGTLKYQIDQFSLSQLSGTVPAGGAANIDVEFIGLSTEKLYSQVIIKITDAPEKDKDGIKYSIKASSFIPKVVTDVYENIFEGQRLCLRDDLAMNDTTSFLEDERCLHFAATCLKHKATVPISIINDQPVPVNCDITLNGVNSFKIDKDALLIAPNSKEIVNVTFCPSESGFLNSILTSTVRGPSKEALSTMIINLEGTGALPVVELENESHKMEVNFGRTIVGTQKEKQIKMINTGYLDSVMNIRISPNPDFTIVGLESVRDIVLKPKSALSFVVCYKPEKVRKGSLTITAKVEDNPESNISIDVVGQGVVNDLIIDGSNIENDVLVFNDVICGRLSTNHFKLTNVSKFDIRYCFVAPSPEYKIIPSKGHLFANNSQSFEVTFLSEKPQKINTKAVCQWSYIRVDKFVEWNDSMLSDKPVANEEQYIAQPVSATSSTASLFGKKTPLIRRVSKKKPAPIVIHQTMNVHAKPEVMPEPSYTVINGKQKDIVLKFSGACDTVRAYIDYTNGEGSNQIEFSPTMMYDARVETVNVCNTSNIRIAYMWEVSELHSMNRSTKCPFSIVPASGFINANSTASFMARFEPITVDDYQCKYALKIQGVNDDPQILTLSGLSRRPVCHFDVRQSNYLNRRHPDFSIPLPEDVKVIEVSSYGIGKRSLFRFTVINTTNMMYETNWELISGPQSIKSITPQQIISAGRKYEMIFEYIPNTLKTIETLWNFSIPKHNIIVPFLVVGRVMPHK